MDGWVVIVAVVPRIEVTIQVDVRGRFIARERDRAAGIDGHLDRAGLAGLQNTPYAALSRGLAVTRRLTLIVNLPGGPKAVEEGMAFLLPLVDHIAELLTGAVEHYADSSGTLPVPSQVSP